MTDTQAPDVVVTEADIVATADLFEAMHDKAAAWAVRSVGLCGTVHHATAEFLARHRLSTQSAMQSERDIAFNQNDAMRQELAHVGNLISDLERAMRVDPADEDGSWPDLAGRINKLIDHARAESPRIEELEAALRKIAADFGDFPKPEHSEKLGDWAWHSMAVEQQSIASAALSAAIGDEFSGWVEVVEEDRG